MSERTSDLEPSGRLIFRRVLFVLACVATLLAVFYTVAKAHGWHPNDIIHFSREVEEAFSYEEAMAIIRREFDTTTA